MNHFESYWGDTIWFGRSPKVVERFVLFPRRDIISGDWIWMEKALMIRRVLTGPGEPIIEDFYTSEENWMMLCLKN